MFFLYILESQKDKTYYVGQTNDLVDRLRRHNSGKIKSTSKKIPYKLVYFEQFEKRSEAMFREWEIKKKFNAERKRKLIRTFDQSKLDTMGL